MATLKRTNKGDVFYLIGLDNFPIPNEIYFTCQEALANQAEINAVTLQGISTSKYINYEANN